MNKSQLLQKIKEAAAQGLISKQEVEQAYDEGSHQEKGLSKKVNTINLFYYIGAAIVFLGIVTLIWQNWSVLSTFTKILVTFGSSIAAYVTGVLLGRYEKLEEVAQSFHLISALVMPIGIYLVFENAGLAVESIGIQTLITTILFAVYLTSFIIFRENLFLLFTIIFGTWFFFSFTDLLLQGNPHLDFSTINEYRILLIGLTYMLLGYSFSSTEREILTRPLYGFGIIGFLGAAFALGGWAPDQNVFWELVFPGLALGTIFLSVTLKSKSFLVLGSIYLIGYILKITAEYFADSLGWPLALTLFGFILIGIGYLSFHLNNKYLS